MARFVMQNINHGTFKMSNLLTHLNLSLNNISNNGAKAIATAIRISTGLTTLDLSNNDIGDDGAKAIVTSLPETIDNVILEFNNITKEYEIQLCKALQKTLKNKEGHEKCRT
jgi:Leucine-rich repeat (LRR) protein